MPDDSAVRLVFLGGLGEIGRNCAAIEVAGRILIIDCGVMFPDVEMPGVDLVLPDFSWLRDNAERVEGCVVTHGHEDHVGGLSFLLREMSLPIFGSPLSLGLAQGRMEEAGVLDRAQLVPVGDGERRRIGPFDVEFLPVTHSVPAGFALAIRTPQGVVLHSGDFKLDPTPVDGRRTDLARIGAIANEEGIRLLLADSTNAEEPGHTPSERSVGHVLRDLFTEHEGKRFIVACFASHIHRIQQVADAAVANGRTVVTLGRSMARNVALARSLGHLTITDESLADIERVDELGPGRTCVVSTGSQGEPMSALSLLAAGEHKFLRVGPGDVVVLSSHAIPGNETAVGKVIDGLYRRGAEVVHAGLADVHVSGHAMQGELQTLLSVARPEHFIPVHGEYRHLVAHAQIARDTGARTDQVFLCTDGDTVVLEDGTVRRGEPFSSGKVFVDGLGVGDVGHAVLRDRGKLSAEGICMAVIVVDARSRLVGSPDVTQSGIIYEPDQAHLLGEAAGELAGELRRFDHDGDPAAIRRVAVETLARFWREQVGRRPVIHPLIVEV